MLPLPKSATTRSQGSLRVQVSDPLSVQDVDDQTSGLASLPRGESTAVMIEMLPSPTHTPKVAQVSFTVRAPVKPPVKPLFPEPLPALHWRWLNSLLGACRRLSPKRKQAAVTALALVTITLQGCTLYFWVNENKNQDQQTRNAHLVFITLANGFLLRFNLSTLNIFPSVVGGGSTSQYDR